MTRHCHDCAVSMVPRTRPRPLGWDYHAGRGVCTSCYSIRYVAGTIDELPRFRMSADELLEEWVDQREIGTTVHEFARRLDRNHLSVRQALLRARKRGDERGVIPEKCRWDEQVGS